MKLHIFNDNDNDNNNNANNCDNDNNDYISVTGGCKLEPDGVFYEVGYKKKYNCINYECTEDGWITPPSKKCCELTLLLLYLLILMQELQ